MKPGSIFPIEEIGAIVKEYGALFHVDARASGRQNTLEYEDQHHRYVKLYLVTRFMLLKV